MSRADTLSRLQELAQLEDGWYDGHCDAPSAAALSLAGALALSLPPDLTPALYPTFEGGVGLEWSLGPWGVSADVQADGQMVHFHASQVKEDYWIARGLQASEVGLLEGMLMTLKEKEE
jgi:hypothetical protein